MLDKRTISEIKQIIYHSLDKKKYKAFIFGSRVIGRARKFSDIDIGIMGKKSLEENILSKLKQEFEDSDIPYTVDIVDFSCLSPRFTKEAGKQIISLN